jgi:hypothetical protein
MHGPGGDAIERETHDHDAADVVLAAEEGALEREDADPALAVDVGRAAASADVSPEASRDDVLFIEVAIGELVGEIVLLCVEPGCGARESRQRGRQSDEDCERSEAHARPSSTSVPRASRRERRRKRVKTKASPVHGRTEAGGGRWEAGEERLSPRVASDPA